MQENYWERCCLSFEHLRVSFLNCIHLLLSCLNYMHIVSYIHTYLLCNAHLFPLEIFFCACVHIYIYTHTHTIVFNLLERSRRKKRAGSFWIYVTCMKNFTTAPHEFFIYITFPPNGKLINKSKSTKWWTQEVQEKSSISV